MSILDNMSPEALAAWASLNAAYGQPLNVNSAYRDPEHNARVGGAKQSQHMHGNAFDVDVAGLPENERLALINLARQNGFGGIGVYDNSLHFDVAGERMWGPDYTNKSIPGWVNGINGTTPLTYGQATSVPGLVPEDQPKGLLDAAQMALGSIQRDQPSMEPIQQQPRQAYAPQRRDIASPYLQLFESLRA